MTTHGEAVPALETLSTAADIASRIGVPASSVRTVVRERGLAHTRVGAPPKPGARDQRRVRFTAEQAEAVVRAMVHHVPAQDDEREQVSA